MEGYKMLGYIGDGVQVANYTIWVCPKTGGHEIQWVSQMIFIINKKNEILCISGYNYVAGGKDWRWD